MRPQAARPILGLRANRGQFALLVLVNAFVGAMVGTERTVLPLLAEEEFGIASASAALSFIVAFGLVKAFTNLAAGGLADRLGRKRLLVLGWMAALPVAPLIVFAPGWEWVVVANVFLGVNQGLAWSMTVIMKIDLVGTKRRGLALGINEAAGYAAVAVAAWVTGLLAAAHGPETAPFVLGGAIAVVGLTLSWLLVADTAEHVAVEAEAHPRGHESAPSFAWTFMQTSFRHRSLSSASQAGLVNNLNDGMAWGLLPLFFAAEGLSLGRIGVVAAVYPATWGVTQLVTGAWSDRTGRKPLIVAGMWIQALAIAGMAAGVGYLTWVGAAFAMGVGTALVYPTLIAAVSDVAAPAWRASAVGIYRLWRDLGFVVGALLTGAVADAFGLREAILTVAALTALSGVVVAARMRETLNVAPAERPRIGDDFSAPVTSEL